MDSHFKLQKLANVDRISNLPDSLLLHILSFLPAKSAAVTTALSKRWEILCMSLPNLDFYYDDFGEDPATKLRFMKFVDNMLMVRRNNVVLERFTMSFGGDIDGVRVDRWLWLPVQYYKVKVIKLSLAHREPYELPEGVYTCRTLEVLCLNWNVLLDVPDLVSLSRLKILELFHVTFSSSDSVEKLLFNCPVLEILFIRECRCLTGCRFNIFASALKTLRLQYCERFEEVVDFEFFIDAPAVENLSIDISEAVEIKTQMLFLETATIDVSWNASSKHTDRLFGLLKKISHVKCLTLTSDTVMALSLAAAYAFPTFHNLTDLELFIYWGAGPAGWSLLPNILASSPILVNLAFPQGLARGFKAKRKLSRFSYSPPEIVPECLAFHLKKIKIGDFRGIAEEFIIVQYLLKHGRVLNMMSIDCTPLWLKEMTVGVKKKPNRPLILSEIKKKLFELYRCSTSCRLDISPSSLVK